MSDRQHQAEVRQRFAAIADGTITDDKTVLDVCPGGGKSRNVRIAVDQLKERGLAGGLIWLVPRASLAAQSRRGFNQPDCPLKLGTVGTSMRTHWGYVATYQKFTSKRAEQYAKGVAASLNGRPGIVLLILDELHHCSNDTRQAWSSGVLMLEKALGKANLKLHVINMTGTLWRGDGQGILHVDYNKDGQAVTHVRYGLLKGREESAVVPPEVVYTDGPVVIHQPSGNQQAYTSMTEVPSTHRSRMRSAFMGGRIGTRYKTDNITDSRQYTSLYLLGYGMDHYVKQRQDYAYPLQTIVVAGTAASALGYTSYLRRVYPNLRVGLSLSDDNATFWGHYGIKKLIYPEMTIVDHAGEQHDGQQYISVNNASESVSTFLDDTQVLLHGVKPANYSAMLNAHAAANESPANSWNELSTDEKIIRAFQADPVDGENIIDVLVTVGKAYEGLDAPRCKHLICLTKQRSAPWLAQCFARAWRRDYGLQAHGVTDQRCWIFVPRDPEMVDAVERIVWDQDLGISRGNRDDDELDVESVAVDPLEPTELTADDVLPEATKMTFEEMLEALERDGDSESEAADFTGEMSDDIEVDDDADDDENKKAKQPSALAYSVIDRVIHEFVDDQAHKMVTLKDEKVTQYEMAGG